MGNNVDNTEQWVDYIAQLKKICEDKGYTQNKIAEITGLKQSNVSRFFGLKTKPNLDTFILLCNCLNVEILLSSK
nr:helix-turn-helix transcriptional regulator [uncultured Flavobacterium sp.]